MEWLEHLQHYHAPPLVLAFLICLGTLISEDLACIAAGILAAKGWLPLPLAMGSSAIGIWGGDVALYGLGHLSRKGKRHWRWLDRLANKERIERGRQLFERFGTRWIFLSRFLPGSRLPSYLAAGAVGWPFPRFASALALAVLIWTPALVSFAFFSSQKTLEILEGYQRWVWPILCALAVFLFLVVKVIVPLFSWQGRRLLAGKWRRLTHWEYWHPAIIYPLSIWPLLFRRLQGGRTLDCLLCNPAIPLSGFAMESKGDILDSFIPPHPEKIHIADYQRFKGKEGLTEIEKFAQKHGWPLVLKPDIGERGLGVTIVQSLREARDWVTLHAESPALVQKHIKGLEVGIHWAQLPNQQQGAISSLARKLPQSLTGNGQDSIEQLILKDLRACAMAKHFLKQFASRLSEIPAKGETIVLTELGTHCLGAVFEDARNWITPELEKTLDEVGLDFEGFHFGRYDVRVPDEDCLRRGEGLVILELNGVTGEPAHIYQPDYSLWQGLKDLRKHYQLASEIGAQLRKEGAKPASWRELIQVIKEHSQQ